MCNNISVSPQSYCITWQLMPISGRGASHHGSTSFIVDPRSVRWTSSSGWTSTGSSASSTRLMLRWGWTGCVSSCPCLCCFVHVLPMSSDDLSHDLEHSYPAMLTCDMSYLLMCCFSFLSVYVVFGWSNKVSSHLAKMFKQMKAKTTKWKHQNISWWCTNSGCCCWKLWISGHLLWSSSPCWVWVKGNRQADNWKPKLVKCVSAETDRNGKQGLLCHCIVPLLSSSVILLHGLSEGPRPEGTIHVSPPPNTEAHCRPVNFTGILNCALQALSSWGGWAAGWGWLSLPLLLLFHQLFRL